MMKATHRFRKASVLLASIATSIAAFIAILAPIRGQQLAASSDSATSQHDTDPLAGLSPENRTLFGTLRNAAQQGDDAATLAAGKKLLPALSPGTPLSFFVSQLTAGSAVETGDTAYALSILKPFTDAYPEAWRAESLLARAYAENGEKTLRDQKIAYVIALHKKTTDPAFAKLHVFPIQKVPLHSGYAVFLYPFEPLGKYNTYLIALVYPSAGKKDYRIELESEDEDQAFFKPKHPGDRRFSIDSYRESTVNGQVSESQALHGFIDGVFDYDSMRDRMIQAANGEKPSAK